MTPLPALPDESNAYRASFAGKVDPIASSWNGVLEAAAAIADIGESFSVLYRGTPVADFRRTADGLAFTGGAGSYVVDIAGAVNVTADTLEAATSRTLATTTPGMKLEFRYRGTPFARFVRTADYMAEAYANRLTGIPSSAIVNRKDFAYALYWLMTTTGIPTDQKPFPPWMTKGSTFSYTGAIIDFDNAIHLSQVTGYSGGKLGAAQPSTPSPDSVFPTMKGNVGSLRRIWFDVDENGPRVMPAGEIRDLALVDMVFDPHTDATRDALIPKIMAWKPRTFGVTTYQRNNSEFFAPPGASLPMGFNNEFYSKVLASRGTRVPDGDTPWSVFWGVDEDLPWGDVRQKVLNYLVIQDVLLNYEFPMESADFVYWWAMRGGFDPLISIMNLGTPPDSDSVQAILTMKVIELLPVVTEDIQRFYERKAKKAKRSAIIKQVATAVAGVLLAVVGIPAVLMYAVKGAQLASGVIDQSNAAEAAGDMIRLSELLKEDNAGFSLELQKTATWLHAEAAEKARNTPMSDEDLAALAEEEGAYRVVIEGRPEIVADSVEDAADKAQEVAVLGDRILIYYKENLVGMWIRTTDGVMKVSNEQISEVAVASPEDVKAAVLSGEAAAAAAAPPSKFPWWLALAPVAVGGVYLMARRK
jgi:hypothetical protein